MCPQANVSFWVGKSKLSLQVMVRANLIFSVSPLIFALRGLGSPGERELWHPSARTSAE